MNQSTKPLIAVKEFPDKKKVVLNLGKLPWQLWVIALIFASGMVGFTATSMLLRLPKSPQCTSIFWPIASASMRIYCAQLEAAQGTVDSLLKAINLVEALPSDHSLRSEINRSVEEWAIAILDIAEEKFQSGQLQEAITIARKVPSHVQVYGVVEERIEKWRSLWQKGEEIFAEVEEKLRQSEWNKAFRSAVKLLSLPNKYWATTEYDATVKQIQLAQEESRKLNKAYQIFHRGGVDNWLAAIADARKISNDSYAHREAQDLIENAKNKLINYIEGLFEARRWQPLLEVVNRLPQSLLLIEEINDWKTLANAGMEAKIGTLESLEMAITSAQVIDADRSLYQKAQDLINRWQLEIEDVTRLKEAQNLARGGTVNDLNAAIAYAELIPSGNPRYQEVRQKIQAWVLEVQRVEDQPILDQARNIARGGTVVALQKAITKANMIDFNRTLYDEAQGNIHQWRAIIQQQEDQPILDQAIFLGNSKNYNGAIQTARRIGRGRVLFREAQNKIGQWQQEIQAQKDLQEAYLIAQGGTSQALGSAIEVIRKIPGSTQVSNRSRQALNQWSYQLLSIAEDKARKALFQEAISLAHIIPAESTSYHGAQTQIRAWQRALTPPSPSTPHAGTKPPAPPKSAVPLTNDLVIETNH
ncbi:MAG: chromosome segregation ATPase [cyanobacterium endosymbiont of Rhopalodia musculus]|uniref:chromosome segregation ATPase n=1 Tax=cyanobacterium endosymbiont of Epithemia clementina EcSB TaxID=3034674 RepID=UPI0024801A89|nr:chromosome segregation ATPase [cyanobacterium endosymbiont of Epithemia clementina EcSB]WGT67513.1 chromosome segregation ATPase [cyanobacterium endosymbiont of Epithemia clementina EcSB]